METQEEGGPRGSLKEETCDVKAIQQTHLTLAQSPGPRLLQPHLPVCPLQGPSPHGWSGQTTGFLGTPGFLEYAGCKEKWMLSQERPGTGEEVRLSLKLGGLRACGAVRWAGRVPYLAGLGTEPSRFPVEDVHSPLLLQRGSHGHISQPISIDVCQGSYGSSKPTQRVSRVTLELCYQVLP